MPDSFELETFVAVEPARVYKAWLDSREHTALTAGGEATVEPWVGGRFTAFDGYIHGIILGLDDGRRIIQTWRTVDFTPEMRDARVVVEFEPVRGGTRVKVRQSETPLDQRARYEKGWAEHYLKRLAKHFAKKRNEQVKPPTAKEKATTWGRPVKRPAMKKKGMAKRPAPRPPAKKVAPRKSASRRPAPRKPAARKSAAKKPAKKSAKRR